ncbi:MAG TPA: MotA/TolQ/ExbB proton channel family protein, partial [Kofleriaceae bacterium]
LREKTASAEDRTLDLIAEALAATAFGLMVAIPAVIAFNYFSRRLRVLLGGADQAAHTVLSLVHGETHVPPKPATAAAIPAPKDNI